MSVTDVEKRPAPDAGVRDEAARRRTFAVISHPDAGKSTLTEALALHASAINTAGAVHGKAGRRGVTSDWMAMEQDRGISITSAVLQFDYDDHVLNLLDTPGHADFSEDTYRVLEAVDCAIMLLDSAKGLEPQTLKLFDVCRSRHVPGRDVREQVGPARAGAARAARRDRAADRAAADAGELAGRDRRRLPRADRAGDRRVHRLHADAGRRRARARGSSCRPTEAPRRKAPTYEAPPEELALLDEIGAGVDMTDVPRRAVVAGAVRRGAAELRRAAAARRACASWRPRPRPREYVDGDARPVDAPFSGLVFKVQANMDPAHRDRVAFVRVCSGRFERGMVLTHAATGRPFATKYAQAMFGQERETVEVAFPGDVIGLVNAGALRPGRHALRGRAGARSRRSRRSRPSTSPSCGARTPGKYKQFRRGIDQLDTEGVVQVLSLGPARRPGAGARRRRPAAVRRGAAPA